MKSILATESDILSYYPINRVDQQGNALKYLKAMQLRKENGFGAWRISKIIDMPIGAVSYWLQGHEPKSIKGINQLRAAELLPLEINETPAFCQLVRTLGLRYADGCVYEQKRNNSITAYLCFGNKIDAIQFCEDAKAAWNINVDPKWGTNAWYVYLPASIGRLLIHLGSPVGDKTRQVFSLPQWIFSLPDFIKWIFLDGLFSGDGSTPCLQQSGTCCSSLGLSISAEKSIAKDFAEAFMTELWNLLRSLGINASKPKVMRNQPRHSKSGKVTYPINIRILTQKQNILNFLQNMPYHYRNSASEKIKNIIDVLRTDNT